MGKQLSTHKLREKPPSPKLKGIRKPTTPIIQGKVAVHKSRPVTQRRMKKAT
jgi:hypothetical protein